MPTNKGIRRNRWAMPTLPKWPKRRPRPIILSLLFLFFGLNLSLAQEVEKPGLNLEELIDEALRKNPQIQAARKEWEAAREKVVGVKALPDPKLGIMFERIPKGTLSLDEAEMRMYTFSQMFPFPGKLGLKGEVAENMAASLEWKYKAREQEIVSKVKKAYWMLFFVHKSIRINKENKDLIQKFAKIAETRYAVGKAPQHDVLKAQVELSLLINELLDLEEERETAEARINTLLNRPISSPVGIPGQGEPSKFDLSLAEVEILALKNRPELKASMFGVKRSKSALSLAKKQYLPDLMLEVSQRDMKGMGLDGWDAMLMVNIPLYFRKQKAGVKEAEGLQQESLAKYESMGNMVRFQVKDSYLKVNEAQRLVELFKNAIIPQAEQMLKAAEVAYETERVDFLTLINSQKTLQDVRLKRYKALTKFEKSLAELERVVGVSLVKKN